MSGWVICGAVLIALLALSLVRIGVVLTYDDQGLHIKARLGLFRLTLYPRGRKIRRTSSKQKHRKASGGKRVAPRPEKAKAGRRLAAAPAGPEKRTEPRAKIESAPDSSSGARPEPPGEKQSEVLSEQNTSQASAVRQDQKREARQAEPDRPRNGGLPLPLMELIDFGLSAAKETIARLQIDCLEVDYTIAGKRDPASAAIQYGVLCAGGGTLVALLENSFYRVRRREICARVDFEGTEPLIWLSLALSLRVGQLIVLACRIGAAFYQRIRKQRQEDDEHGTKASDQ